MSGVGQPNGSILRRQAPNGMEEVGEDAGLCKVTVVGEIWMWQDIRFGQARLVPN
jgi:hypothetical protein